MRKIFTLLILLLLLPVTALAADMNTVYVGGVALTGSSDCTVYATTNESGEVITNGADANNYNIKWDGSTLTLKNAYITNEAHEGSYLHPVEGAAIGVANSSGDAKLTIQLESGNKIEDVSLGIWVYSSATGYASLTITGAGNLTASGSVNPGILVQSNGGNATLSIENAEVTTTSSSSDGVLVRAKDGSNASLTVNGGSLTATGKSEDGAGIRYTFSGGISGSGKPSLTVSGNAMVKASGDTGGITSNSSTVTPSGTGIVFNNGTGTVYGSVTLQEDLTIGEDESLTIGKDASLTVPSGTTLTNNGTVTTTDGGSLTNQGTINNSGTLPDSIEGSQPPKITTASLSDGTVNTAYNQPLAADNNPTSWSVTNGALPNGLTLEKGTISGIPTAAGTSTFTVKAENTAGSDSKELTLTINPAPVLVTSVALNKSELSLYTGQSEILTATVQPEDATNKNVTWSSDNADVATVDNGTVTAVSAGTATITVTTADGSKTATCTVTVTVPVTGVKLNKETLELFTDGSETLTATVQPSDATNQNVTWSSDKPEVATVDNGKVTAVGAGEATITATAGGITATCVVHVRKPATVEASGSTNLSFTTDRDEFTLTAIVYGENLSQEPNCWEWTVANTDVVSLSDTPNLRSGSVASSRKAFTIKGTGTTTITATYDDGTYRGSVDFKVRISKPTPPDPISYYNIYVEDVCDGVEVSTSKQVVREGGSINVYVEKDTARYTFDNFKVYYKRSYYGTWDELKEGTQPGEYPIKNIWTHIYIKAEGAEEKEDPTGIESIEGVKVYTKDGSLYVQTPQREQVIIVSMSGAVVKNEEQIGLKQYHGLQPGIYIVRVGDRAYKVRLN